MTAGGPTSAPAKVIPAERDVFRPPAPLLAATTSRMAESCGGGCLKVRAPGASVTGDVHGYPMRRMDGERPARAASGAVGYRSAPSPAPRRWWDRVHEGRNRAAGGGGVVRFFDFHNLRNAFISSLAANGVHPPTAQRMARHADINLTLSRYTHVGREDEAKAVEGLPGIGGETAGTRREAA